ncbi:cytochrome-c peroxidase [Mangrovicoccus sp. HB161399]|uniref:cytochrome-c peroxidase n=1 Tax=Mangrovicoccus sp. HB161399 TaxID=2720392 RepID=UPI00155193DE|nr:cytochrome c peroxidase [Mangrovicoccus sp. HB161399]
MGQPFRLIPAALGAAILAFPAVAGEGFPEFGPAEVKLGQLLFYDPVLSGNREVACATCHHPRFGTSDGVSLGIGDGGIGLGPERHPDRENLPERRVPRNATALFNLGYPEFRVMFHDGRLEEDAGQPGGIRTPLGSEMVAGFDGVLAAQTMFPVLSQDEMSGHYGENEVSKAVRQGLLTGDDGAWARITARVAAIPAYRDGFAVLGDDPLDFTDIANALAAFIAVEWRADDSPYDRFLAGAPLPPEAEAGRQLFHGKAGCSACHSGRFQTDQAFHAIAMPQIGPGKAARFETGFRDEGRQRVTGAAEDAYRFRTPSLRNVAQTAPYGHDGAYASLEAVVRHHLDPVAALARYDLSQARLPHLPGARDHMVLADPPELDRIAAANELQPVTLADAEVAQILAFLGSLTDPASLDGRLGVPDAVPSGLPVPR